ncbi:hypothetical protein U1Q18_015128, partial [Sarracenia purpurea var. burkii]
MIHHQAVKLLKLFCRKVVESNSSSVVTIFGPALFGATYVGIYEIVEEILASCPTLITFSKPDDENASSISFPNLKDETLFRYAIEWPQERQFNLIHQIEPSWICLLSIDALGNNALQWLDVWDLGNNSVDPEPMWPVQLYRCRENYNGL